MNILIVGCGKVGSNLAGVLSRMGHDISIVNRTPDGFDLLPSDFNGFTTVGVPIDQEVLRKAGIESCDVVAAVTPDDNINIMVSELATEIFKVNKVFVRIYDPQRDDVFSNLGLCTICPTNLTVSSICAALRNDTETVTTNLAHHAVEFYSMPIPKSFIGLNASNIKYEKNEILYAVENENGVMKLVGLEDVLLEKGDKLIFSKIVD